MRLLVHPDAELGDVGPFCDGLHSIVRCTHFVEYVAGSRRELAETRMSAIESACERKEDQ